MNHPALLALLALAPASMAATIWDINADDMSASQPPAVATVIAGATNTRPQIYTNGNATNKVEVVNNFIANGKTMTGHSLVFTKTVSAANQELALVGAAADWNAWQDFQLSFDLLADTRNTGQPLNVRLTTTDSNINVGFLTFDMDGSLILSSSLSSSATKVIANAWQPADINSVIVQVNAATKTVTAFINGTALESVSLDLADAITNPLGINRVRFRNNSNNQLYAYGFAIDNIVTTTTLAPIPEPSTVALLLGAGALGFALRQRQQQRRG